MNVVFLDFETYWSSTHSLTKMNPVEYVMHPDTEIISCSIKQGFNTETRVFVGEDAVAIALSSIDWKNTMVVAHNMSGFDSMILAWRFGKAPKMWGCTLAMAKPLHMKTCGVSLKALVEHYGIGVKDAAVLTDTKGMHLKDFTSDQIERMRIYNKADTEQCAALFRILRPTLPVKEMFHIDATIRMLVGPKFVADVPLLESTLIEEREAKHDMLLKLATSDGFNGEGLTDDELVENVTARLSSPMKFSQLLKDLGAEVPMKPSPSDPSRLIPALAKTDEQFIALTQHENPLVAAAANARLGVKSTLLETRIEAFLAAAKAAAGNLPIPLVYYGGHTGRWSGWGYNPQNLPRIPRDKQGNIIPKLTNALRMSMRAPKGYKVVVSDLSGIELRVNHFLWKVPSSMALFKADPEKADLYKDFASGLYNVAVSEVSKDQRQIGKVAHLGLGFAAGAATFVRIAKIMGGVDITYEEALDIVTKWRSQYAEISGGWRKCERALSYMIDGDEMLIDPWGLCCTGKDAITLPSGRQLLYPRIRRVLEAGRANYKFGEGSRTNFMNGGKCDENIVQAIARDVIADNMLSIYQTTKYRPALMVHDELVYVVPESEAEDFFTVVNAAMRLAPKWWPELVTWSEGDIADTYGDAK